MAELQKSEIVERIKQARIEAGLTQPEIADLLDVGLRTYQNYESNRVPWALMSRISDVTGRSVRWLLHGEEEPGATPELMRRLSVLEHKLDELREASGLDRAATDDELPLAGMAHEMDEIRQAEAEAHQAPQRRTRGRGRGSAGSAS